MCTRHPDLVAIPDLLIILVQVSSNATSSKKYHVVGRLFMYVDKCTLKLEGMKSHGKFVAIFLRRSIFPEFSISTMNLLSSPHLPSAACQVADSKLSILMC